MVPGDEATLMAGATASQADIDLLRARLGLDRPLAEQYATRLAGLARGDFGYSSTFRGNPLPHVLARLPATLLLMAAAILTTVLLGLPAGVVAAVAQTAGRTTSCRSSSWGSWRSRTSGSASC